MAERLLAAALAVASGEMKMGWRAGQAGVRVQVEDTGSDVRPATARGLRGQATGDARHTRGHRVLNRPSTVASEFFVSVLNGAN